jgi:hypothetical protein
MPEWFKKDSQYSSTEYYRLGDTILATAFRNATKGRGDIDEYSYTYRVFFFGTPISGYASSLAKAKHLAEVSLHTKLKSIGLTWEKQNV